MSDKENSDLKDRWKISEWSERDRKLYGGIIERIENDKTDPAAECENIRRALAALVKAFQGVKPGDVTVSETEDDDLKKDP